MNSFNNIADALTLYFINSYMGDIVDKFEGLKVKDAITDDIAKQRYFKLKLEYTEHEFDEPLNIMKICKKAFSINRGKFQRESLAIQSELEFWLESE